MTTTDPCFVPTKSSMLAENIKHEVFEYVSRKSKNKRETVGGVSKKKADTSSEDDGLNVIKLKQEVARFGMSGFTPKDEKEAKIQLAIKLGAKPPKNKYKNYKVLMEERKKSVEQQKREKQQFELRTQLQSKVMKNKQRPKSVSSNLLGGYGKVDKNKIKQVKSKR